MIRISLFCLMLVSGVASGSTLSVYDATIEGKEILTPAPADAPFITSAGIYGARPGKPVSFRVSCTGERPLSFEAQGLPAGLSIDAGTGWIRGLAPSKGGDVTVRLSVSNAKGKAEQEFILRVGDTICLTPTMGWNSWYVLAMSVSEKAIREAALAMQEKGLDRYGWTYVNIDDCWSGERNKKTGAPQANSKFNDMKELVKYVNERGFKLGIYSTPWMSTYCGYIGGSAPNEQYDYSGMYLPKDQQLAPGQYFGVYPAPVRNHRALIGPVWLVDRDAKQFAEWGIDFVKYDWKEWTLVNGKPEKGKSSDKTEAVAKRFFEDFRSVDRDIVLSLSPNHSEDEDKFVPRYCNLWRLTGDIHAKWECLTAPFSKTLTARLSLSKPGCYGDLDMLQVGPLGKPNSNNTDFKPSPLTPAEQYFQISLWCILTQPLLLSCHIPSMDAFDLNLVCNHEVLAVNQDVLCKQGYRVLNQPGSFEVWAKDLADGGKAVGLFNLSQKDQVITVSADKLGISGKLRDLWRQKDIGEMKGEFSAKISPHGVLFVRIEKDN